MLPGARGPLQILVRLPRWSVVLRRVPPVAARIQSASMDRPLPCAPSSETAGRAGVSLMFGCAVLLALLPTCASTRSSRRDTRVGSPSDVKIRAGKYDGYEIHRVCTNGSGTASVIGLGHRRPEFLSTKEMPAAKESFRAEALAVAQAKSLVASGFGVHCADHRGAFLIDLYDFREVDPILERLGTWMARQDLGLEIVLLVSGVPVIN
jgi:hypothetical protein